MICKQVRGEVGDPDPSLSSGKSSPSYRYLPQTLVSVRTTWKPGFLMQRSTMVMREWETIFESSKFTLERLLRSANTQLKVSTQMILVRPSVDSALADAELFKDL